jgi:hypothetical protein
VALAFVVAALGAATLAAVPRAEPQPQLPDLVAAPPQGLVLEKQGGGIALGFNAAAENRGEGPLIVQGERAEGGPPRMDAEQLIAGSDDPHPLASPLDYEDVDDHAHWHFEDFMRYELRHADGGLAAIAKKAGFCLGDRYEASPAVELPGEPELPPFVEGCGQSDPGRTQLREGLSVDHGDDYGAYLHGQSLDLTGLPPGRYLLVHTVNPDHELREADFSNNTSSLPLAIERPRGPAARPRLRLGPDRKEGRLQQ